MISPNEFVRQFALPLVAGGAVHVDAPLGRRGLERLRRGPIDPALENELADARLAVARTLLIDPIPPLLDAETWRLAVAVHDLMFLFHPTSRTIGQRRLGNVSQFAAALAALPDTTDADTLVARHSLLHQFPSLGRNDVRISYWVGRREFHGKDPPKRLTAWPELRRVREERWRTRCFDEAATHPLGGAVVRALLDGSPLTDLLHPVRTEPKFSPLERMAILAQPELCRAVAYHYLEMGVDRLGAPLAQAILASTSANEDFSDERRQLCAFVAHLHLCTLLGQCEPGRTAATTRAALVTDPELRDFYGLFAALHRMAGELAAPLDVRRDPTLFARVAAYAEQCALLAGAARVGELCAFVTESIIGGGTVAQMV